MRRTAYIIGIIMAAAAMSGCGIQTKTTQQETVRPKEASVQVETQKVMESKPETESQKVTETQAAGTSQKVTEEQIAGGSQKVTEQNPETTAEGLITEEEARAIALKDAEVAEADVSGLRIKLDQDDGIFEYEVEFYVGREEYDYDIDAATGKIRSMDRDIEDDFMAAGQPAGQIISEEEAKQLVLDKVPQATEQDLRIKLEEDDGRQIYEGSIYSGGKEYEFEIDASRGVILEWEEDD